MAASGEQCVTMSGTSEMLRWCAEPWTVARLRQPNPVHSLVKAKETSGWMMSAVSVMRRPFCNADIPPSEKITVAMAKMPAWCAQVSYCSFLFVSTLVSHSVCIFTFICRPVMPPVNILLIIAKNYITVVSTTVYHIQFELSRYLFQTGPNTN